MKLNRTIFVAPLAMLLAACGPAVAQGLSVPEEVEPTPTATSAPTPTATSAPTATPVPTSTPTPTATPVPAPTSTPTPVPAATPTAIPTATPIPVVLGGVGSAVINELMIDPVAVADQFGEWFEVYNPSRDLQLDINGWTIRGDGSTGHVIDNSGPLLVPQEGFVVLARSGERAVNGEVDVAYRYEGISLGNSGDEVVLVDWQGIVVDAVEYPGSMAYSGASASLNPLNLDATANDSRSSWCRASTQFGNGDQGTPGAANDSC